MSFGTFPGKDSVSIIGKSTLDNNAKIQEHRNLVKRLLISRRESFKSSEPFPSDITSSTKDRRLKVRCVDDETLDSLKYVRSVLH